MKTLILFVFCTCFCMFGSFSQDSIYIPSGSLIQSLRNDNKSEIIIPRCDYDGLKMDDINNLYGNYWGFYLVGTIDGLTDIIVKPYCPSQKIALQKGCGYVAYHNSGSGATYVRIYVTEMVTNKEGEIIGATLLYQTDYQSEWEKKQAEQRRAEKEAAKIFWNGDVVPDAVLRKTLLDKFDVNNDGKISQIEAAQKTSLTIEDGNSIPFNETGINNLTGLTSLMLRNTSISGDIVLTLPNLHKFSLADNKRFLDKLDLTGCANIDSVWVGGTNIDIMTLRNCKKLKLLNSYNSNYYTTVNELLEVSGCTSLNHISGGFRGKSLDASGCTALDGIEIIVIDFNEINLSDCTNLDHIYSIHDGHKRPEGYELKKLTIEGCSKLNWVELNFRGCEISELNLSNCRYLRRLELRSPVLSELNLLNCRELGSLTLDSTVITTLDLSGMKHLNYLSCYRNSLKMLNLSDCDSITQAWCNDNKLESINLSNCHNLKELYCQRNALISLDVTDCDSLRWIFCCRNHSLQALDISKNLKLEGIQCSNTSIQELDISHSETTEWAFSESGAPIRVPGATQGFKTLWVNENQEIEIYTREDSIFKGLKDRDIDKNHLLSSIWLEYSHEYVAYSPADLNFKIKVRK